MRIVRSLVFVVALLVAAASGGSRPSSARAADPVNLTPAVIEIETQFNMARYALADRCAKAKDWTPFAAEFAKIRAVAMGQFEALVAKHGPGGTEPDAEVGKIYQAMVSPVLTPRGEPGWAIARTLLAADPQTSYAWSVLCELRAGVEAAAYHADEKPSWTLLQKWTIEFRADASAVGETQSALDLLLARLALDQGVVGQARRLADTVLANETASVIVRDAARRIRGRSSLRPAGMEAPPFRLAGADGADVALAELRGRIVVVLFAFEDDEERMLRAAVTRLTIDLAGDDIAFVTVPLSTPSATWNPGPTETVVQYGDLGRKVADAYGVLDTSALFVLGPSGTVLASQGWDARSASEDVVTLARTALGAPLPELLESVAKDPSWASFASAWRRLLARRGGDFDSTTWAAARTAGPRAVQALLVAAAEVGRKPEVDDTSDASSLHGRIIGAFVSHRFGAGEDAWRKIVVPLATKSDVEGFQELADAFNDLGLVGDDVRQPLEQLVVKGKDWRLVSTALRALAQQDTDAAPPRPVASRNKDKVWQVRLAAAEALRAYRHPDTIAPLIELVGDERQRVRCEAAASLKALTREDFGVSQKAWTTWRRAQGQKLELPPRELNVASLSRSSGHDYAVSTYFGARVASDRVVLILDKSETMFYSLFDTGVEEVRAFLEGSGPTMSFNVVQFAEAPQSFRKKLVPANASNVAAAVEFLTKDQPYGATNVADALREALAVEDVDTIVYLSDGEPANRGSPTVPAELLAEVAKLNRYLRATIHCLWMTPGRRFPYDGPRGKDKPPLDDSERERRKRIREHAADYTETCVFLQALAAAHGGSFGVAFGDQYDPPAGATTRPSTDK